MGLSHLPSHQKHLDDFKGNGEGTGGDDKSTGQGTRCSEAIMCLGEAGGMQSPYDIAGEKANESTDNIDFLLKAGRHQGPGHTGTHGLLHRGINC